MRLFYASIILLLFSNLVHSQNLIVGCVKDTADQPIHGVSIFQSNQSNHAVSDKDGYFQILVDKDLEKKLTFKGHGYQYLDIYSIDTISQFQNIVLLAIDYRDLFWKQHHRKTKEKSSRLAIEMDAISPDFNQFSDKIGVFNTDKLNGVVGIFNLKLTRIYNRKRIGFGYGIIFAEWESDSLNLKIIKSLSTINLGYRLIDSHRILFEPNIGVKWYRYRLLNYERENKIPLTQYLNNRDLDIRFNQVTGYLGSDIAYKIYPKKNTKRIHVDYWAIGIYGGYLFRLHNKPLLYSRGNRLQTEDQINLKNYNWGISLSTNFGRSY